MYLSKQQFDTLMRPLNASRVATRSQGGKQLSYLEAWDVKAHLTRIFGFGNWDAEILKAEPVGTHDYISSNNKPMIEVMWHVTLRLTIRTHEDVTEKLGPVRIWHETVYTESAVGSATGSRESSGHGDLHDNAVKQAASDALKRCAINLGTQFGLSLYNDGSRNEIIKKVLVGDRSEPVEQTPEQKEREANLSKTVGAQPQTDPSSTEAQATDGTAEAILREQLGATEVKE